VQSEEMSGMILKRIVCHSGGGRLGRFPTKAAPIRSLNVNRPFSSTAESEKPKLCVVDLRGTGYSFMERLCVEEFLSQTKTELSWLVIGMHEPSEHRHIHLTQKAPAYIEKSVRELDHYNPSCAVVVHPREEKKNSELNIPMIVQDGVLCLESSKGESFMGESVVLDHSSLITTLIAPDETYTSEKFMTNDLWVPTFARLEKTRLQSPSSRSSPLTMVMDTKSCGFDNNGKKVSLDELKRNTDLTFETTGKALRLDDLGIDDTVEAMPPEMSDPDQTLPLTFAPPHYYLLGDYPVGMINTSPKNISRTIFMWNYDDENQSYLSCPPPRSISTAPFLRLEQAYQKSGALSEVLQLICQEHFSVESMNSRELLKLMAQEKTGLQDWWENRTSWKIVEKF
jgi:hypothetical protein